jgi:hypothetical protein
METTNALAPNLTAAESIRGTLAKSTLDMLQAGESRIQDAAKAAAASAVESVMGAMGQLLDETEARLAGLKPAVLTIQMPDMREITFDKPIAECLPRLLKLLAANLIPVLVGPRGSGKTTAAKQAAKALQAQCFVTVFSAGMTKSDVYGSYHSQGYAPSVIVQAIEASQTATVVLFIDEIDAANEQMLVALNNLFDQSGAFTNMVTGEQYSIDFKRLLIVAGANTFARGGDALYTGRSRLDGATIDRFWPLYVGYSRSLEQTIAKAYSADTVLLETLWHARERLEELGSDEGISTRRIEHVHRAHYLAGESLEQVFASLTGGWPEGLAAQVGLSGDAPAPKRRKGGAQ